MKSGETDWRLPPFIVDRINHYTGNTEMEDLSRLWLGYGDNYVAEIHSNDYHYHVNNYGRLQSELKQVNNEWASIKV